MSETGKMQALVYDSYGSPENLHFKNIDIPVPKDNEVLIKVFSVSIGAGDFSLLAGSPFFMRFGAGILRPYHKILGRDVAGRVVGIGKRVTDFKIGDDVYSTVYIFDSGTFSEYVSLASNIVAKKPENLSFDEAAAIPNAALTSLQAIRNVPSGSARKVLIYGASGGVGSLAIQMAKAENCEVTAVCSTRNVDAATHLGADHIVDYTIQSVFEIDRKYDLIFAINGSNSIFEYKKLLSKDGVYVTIGGSAKQMLQAMVLGNFIFSNKMFFMGVQPSSEDLYYVKTLVEDGKLKPTIDKIFSKESFIDAINYVYNGKSKGKVVVKIFSE